MEEPHEREADRLEDLGDELESAGADVDREIKNLREDWESKKSGTDAGAADPADSAPGGLGEEEMDGSDSGESEEEAAERKKLEEEDAVAYAAGEDADFGDHGG